jgi:hypothetical protein
LITNVGSVIPLVFINLLPNEDPQLTARTATLIAPDSAIEHPQTGIVGNQSFMPNMSPELLEVKSEK